MPGEQAFVLVMEIKQSSECLWDLNKACSKGLGVAVCFH